MLEPLLQRRGLKAGGVLAFFLLPKKLCDSGEVSKHLWASVFSSDELGDF